MSLTNATSGTPGGVSPTPYRGSNSTFAPPSISGGNLSASHILTFTVVRLGSSSPGVWWSNVTVSSRYGAPRMTSWNVSGATETLTKSSPGGAQPGTRRES